jgi:2,3-bisphosphoglycerate-independent phosphoglycerate mutase
VPARIALFFIDGFGWGGDDPDVNPQHSYGGDLLRLPTLRGDGPQPIARGGWAVPVDAVLGVEGVPQSATGQTTLLSGVSAQGVLGKHLTGFPNEALREVLREHSLLRQVTQAGLQARFLNVFRPRFWELSPERQWTLSATTVANLAADLPFFGHDDLHAQTAIYQDFTNEDLIARGFDVPAFTPAQAGRILGQAVRRRDFTLYEYFLSDKAGHTGEHAVAAAELVKLDAFLGAALDELRDDLQRDTLLLICSDHGNLEDMSTRRHTTNPVPLMAWGRGAEGFVAPVRRLDQVTPAIVERLRAGL